MRPTIGWRTFFAFNDASRVGYSGTADDPVMVFDDDEGKRVDHPIEVG